MDPVGSGSTIGGTSAPSSMLGSAPAPNDARTMPVAPQARPLPAGPPSRLESFMRVQLSDRLEKHPDAQVAQFFHGNEPPVSFARVAEALRKLAPALTVDEKTAVSAHLVRCVSKGLGSPAEAPLLNALLRAEDVRIKERTPRWAQALPVAPPVYSVEYINGCILAMNRTQKGKSYTRRAAESLESPGPSTLKFSDPHLEVAFEEAKGDQPARLVLDRTKDSWRCAAALLKFVARHQGKFSQVYCGGDVVHGPSFELALAKLCNVDPEVKAKCNDPHTGMREAGLLKHQLIAEFYRELGEAVGTWETIHPNGEVYEWPVRIFHTEGNHDMTFD